MTTQFLGLALCMLVGAGCRYFAIPLPAPERFVGVFLLLAMTLGFVTADRVVPHGETIVRLGSK